MTYVRLMKKAKQPRQAIPKESQDFAKFRDQWMRNLLLVDNKTLPSGAKIVGVRIALYMHQNQQWAFPSYAKLADATGFGVRIVQKYSFALVDQKFLFINRRRNVGNQYFLDSFWEKDIVDK